MLGDLVIATAVVVGIFLFIFLMGGGNSPRTRRRDSTATEENGTQPIPERVGRAAGDETTSHR